MLCALEGVRRESSDLQGPYSYFKTCDDIKYHISEEETTRHKGLA